MRGRNWIDNSEGIWNGLMNCTGNTTVWETTGTELVKLQQEECSRLIDYYDDRAEMECYQSWDIICQNNPADCWEERDIRVRVVTNGRSDGFICADSQSLGDVFFADGVNHEEASEDARVMDQIRLILDGRSDDIFETE